MIDSRIPILIAAGLSSCCSCMLLACFYILKKWASHPRGGKHILFVTTIFNLVMALNYFLDPENEIQCQVQSTLMQFFEIAGSWTYTMFLALELALSLRISAQTNERIFENSPNLSVFLRPRIFKMHIAAFAYGIISTLLMHILRKADKAGAWCWSPSKTWLLSTYLILWLQLFIIMSSCAFIAMQLFHKSHISASLRHASLRLLAIPLGFSLLHVPGTIRRCGDILNNCTWCEGRIVRFLQGICDPSQGSLNFLLYGLTDSQLRRDLHSWLEHRQSQTRTRSSPDDSLHSNFSSLSELPTNFLFRSCFCFCCDRHQSKEAEQHHKTKHQQPSHLQRRSDTSCNFEEEEKQNKEESLEESKEQELAVQSKSSNIEVDNFHSTPL
uniref:G-protein coupled receptors family 2 profile 2 domain-containing protein n=1 Tax=Aureoumbra lagunensis TaxID=44058 RepID=A0A7S3K412_9STRA|mmetsp:Transcript_7772/g.10832  ORF Transcript_7772/g.10832 Transcript_7772/m.10832 type:complete len:384 (-) Transcript_7772:58-1209(-)